MNRILQCLNRPAAESHLGMALAVASLTIALLFWGVLWQASVIAHQREVIHMLWKTASGG